jgi:hypothetical protein
MNDTTIRQIGNLVAKTSRSLTFKLEGPGIPEDVAASVEILTNGTLGESMFTVCFVKDGRTLVEVYVRTGRFGQKGSSVEVSHPSGGGTPAQFRLRAKVFEQALNLAAGVEDIITSEGK